MGENSRPGTPPPGPSGGSDAIGDILGAAEAMRAAATAFSALRQQLISEGWSDEGAERLIVAMVATAGSSGDKK